HLLYCSAQGLDRRGSGVSAGQRRPNKSFKPNPLRYAKHMAGKACHVFRFTTLLGLTLVLGATWSTSVNWKKIVMFAAAAFFAEVVVGFMMGGTALSNDLAAAKERWAWSAVLSFLFATLIFAALAVRQYNRP